MENGQNFVVKQILKVAKDTEDMIDAELQKLENVSSEEIEKLRSERLAEMKKESNRKRELRLLGHGFYEELPEEKEFFAVTKKSENVVVHFYRNETARCKIFDHHLKILAPQHVETKFVKLNVEKCLFLTERLTIKVLPTLLSVINGKVKDRIIGFSDLGNCDDFSTELLEWRLAQSGVIKYSGDLINPPENRKTQKTNRIHKTIRDKQYDSSDTDSD